LRPASQPTSNRPPDETDRVTGVKGAADGGRNNQLPGEASGSRIDIRVCIAREDDESEENEQDSG
jgi:hypothetical protein